MSGVGDNVALAALVGGGAFLTWLVVRRPDSHEAAAPSFGWIGLDVRALVPADTPRNAARDRLVYRPVGASGEPYPDWVRALKGKSGVYVIRDRRSGETLYVGSSRANLYDTVTRHLQTWRRWTKRSYWPGQYARVEHDPGLTYDRDQVEIAVRVTPLNRALDEESRLIRTLKPRDNIIGQPEPEPALEPAPF